MAQGVARERERESAVGRASGGTVRMSTPLFPEAELRDLVSRDEGQFLEFKSTWDRSGDIADASQTSSGTPDAIAETVDGICER